MGGKNIFTKCKKKINKINLSLILTPFSPSLVIANSCPIPSSPLVMATRKCTLRRLDLQDLIQMRMLTFSDLWVWEETWSDHDSPWQILAFAFSRPLAPLPVVCSAWLFRIISNILEVMLGPPENLIWDFTCQVVRIYKITHHTTTTMSTSSWKPVFVHRQCIGSRIE